MPQVLWQPYLLPGSIVRGAVTANWPELDLILKEMSVPRYVPMSLVWPLSKARDTSLVLTRYKIGEPREGVTALLSKIFNSGIFVFSRYDSGQVFAFKRTLKGHISSTGNLRL